MHGAAADHDTTDIHRFHNGHRRQGPHATDTDLNFFNDGYCLCRGKFARLKPSGDCVKHYPMFLQSEIIHFDNDAVNFIWKIFTHGADAFKISDARVNIAACSNAD
jgi:hypothetical protein